MNIPKIVLSGGPCAGKTSALARIAQFCQQNGYFPVILPEAATALISSGLNPSRPSFQTFVTKQILQAEEIRLAAAEDGHFGTKPVFIYDRGICDARAYVEEDVFQEALANCGITTVRARDTYDGVIFLDSTAVGAEAFYTHSNNEARGEDLEMARAINARTINAWMGTPHFFHVQNRPGHDFNHKLTECLQALARILGIPEPVENERKFLLTGFQEKDLPEISVPIQITQTYLVSDSNTVERVRTRGQDNHHLYFHTIKRRHYGGGSVEIDRLIDQDEYNRLLRRTDHTRRTIEKTRHCFLAHGHYCEVDVFEQNHQGLILLEIEVHDFTDPVTVPEFLGPYKEVTQDLGYSNHHLARLT